MDSSDRIADTDQLSASRWSAAIGRLVLRGLLAGYAVLSQLGLLYLHFVVAAPYLLLVVLPIPLLAPVVLLPVRFRWSRRLFLICQVGGASVQMLLRALLDLWLPLRI